MSASFLCLILLKSFYRIVKTVILKGNLNEKLITFSFLQLFFQLEKIIFAAVFHFIHKFFYLTKNHSTL